MSDEPSRAPAKDQPRALALRWFALGAMALFFLFEFVARIEPSLASASIAAHFGLSNAGFGVLSSLFFWVYAPMQIVVGIGLDRCGVRRLVVPATLLCGAGVIGFAATANPAIAGAGRVATGLGASFAFVGSLYVINHHFSPRRFALLSGAVNAAGMVGTAVGAVGLTAAMDQYGWRSVFVATGVFGVFVFGMAFAFVRDHAGTLSGGDGVGSTLREVLRSGRVWAIAALGSLYYVPVNVFGGLWGQRDLVEDHHLAAVSAETTVSMVFWGTAVGNVLGGLLSDRIGHRKWIVGGSSLTCAAAYAVAVYVPLSSTLGVSVLLFFAGLAGGPQMLAFAMAKEGLPKRFAGTVVAFVNMIGIGAALVFQPLVGMLLDTTGDFRLALTPVPVCVLVAAAMTVFVREQRHPEHQ